ncbi:MAG: Sec-independent protein translocase protein TatB [Pseudomonadota bacterium]
MNLVPQFGFLELILIAVLALIVVGPKDLPKLMRGAGRMMAKARSMAAEFTSAFDDMARETEMEELRRELDALKNDNAVTKAKREFDEAVAPIKSEMSSSPDSAPPAAPEPRDKAEAPAATAETVQSDVAR